MNCMGLGSSSGLAVWGCGSGGWGHEVNSESRSGNLPIEDPEREKSNVHPLLYMSALHSITQPVSSQV